MKTELSKIPRSRNSNVTGRVQQNADWELVKTRVALWDAAAAECFSSPLARKLKKSSKTGQFAS